MPEWFWYALTFLGGCAIGAVGMRSWLTEQHQQALYWWQEKCICTREENKGRKVTQTFTG